MSHSENKYSPFHLIEDPDFNSLILDDGAMVSRVPVFQEKDDEGWEGNGYDWTSIARVVIDERLKQYDGQYHFDPEAGMMSIQGPVDALKALAAELVKVYQSEEDLRDLLSRAELD